VCVCVCVCEEEEVQSGTESSVYIIFVKAKYETVFLRPHSSSCVCVFVCVVHMYCMYINMYDYMLFVGIHNSVLL